MENRKKNNVIAIIAILLIVILAFLAGKWIVDSTNESYSYELVDGLEGLSDEIDKQTNDYKKRAEEAQKKYEDSIKYLD